MARIVSDKEARKLKINLQTDSGEQFGQVSVSAHNAITGGYLDKYTPVDDAEKKVIDAYKSKLQTKTPTYQERKVERSSRIKEIDAEIGAIKDTNAHNNYTSATRNLAVARRSVGVVGRKQIKSLEEKQKAAKKKYTKATADLETLSAEKLQIESTQKMDDVAEKYKIDPENFSYGDFKKWADNHNHNFSINSNGGAVITPKKTATVQEKEEAKILEAIAFDVANRKAAVEAPVLSSAITVAGAPVRGVMGAISTIEDNINVARGKEIDLFSVSKRPARMTSTIRGTVDEEYASKWFGGKELPVIGNVGSMLYNTGMSIGDNAVNMAVGSVFGKALSLSGVSSAATNKAVSYLTSGLMASDATTMAIISNKERGLSDEAALAQGLATGLIELVTEKWSIEKIISEPKTVLSGVLKSMGAEGSEEMTSEVLNKTIDILANKDKSHLQVTIKQYIEDGYTEKEAVTKAWGDMFADVISSGVSGMLSGGVMSGVHQGITNSSRRNEITKTNDVIKTINQIAGKEIIKPLSNNASEEAIYQKQNEIGTQNFSDLQSIALPGVLGENGQKAFSSNFREGQNEADYTMGFRRMYNLGQSNISLEKASAEIKGNKYIQSLSPDQRMAAYYSGQNDAKAQLEAERDSVKYVEFYSDDAGVVENDAAKRVDAEELKAIDRLARTVGAQVVFEEEIEGFNGYVELGKIHISLNAENKLAVVAAHEVTHRMQELAPESYRKYRDFVMASVGVEVVESYQKKLNEKDIYLSDSEVMDEIAADYTKKILADPQSMQKFVDDALNGKLDETASVAENRNILRKLFDSIKEFIKKVSEKFSGRKAEQNQAARDAYGVDLETLKQAKNLLQKALKDSADVVSQFEKQGTKENAEIKGKKKFSVMMNGKEEVVFERSFSEQVSETLSKNTNLNDRNHIFVCKTTSILRQCGLPDLPILITKGHIRDMNHEEVEGVSKYHGLSEPEINKIPYILENPAMVFETISDKNTDAVCILSNVLDSKDRPILITIKPNGEGRYNEIKVDSNFLLSAYGRNNAQRYLEQIGKKSENVIYINKKRTQDMLKAARLQLPAELSNLRSDIIIHKIDNNVNTQSMQKSKNNSQRKNSVKMDEDLLKQNEQLKKAYSLLSAEFSRFKSEKRSFRKEKIATVTKKILNDFDFAYDAELLSGQMEGLAEDTKQMIAGNMDLETFRNKVFDVAKDVVEAGTRSDSLAYTESKAVRDYLRTTKITLSEEARNNLGDEYETIRKSTFGRLRLAKEGGIPIDVAYQELSELYPEYFSTETETNASAQLRQIQSVLDGLQSLKSDAFGGYTDEAAEWLSSLMIDQIYNEVFVSGDGGKTTVSVDIKAMRTEMADNLQKIMNRERGWREREYNKLQKQFEKKTRNYTESRQKAVKIKQIKLHTERLSKALINPSERFAVPEDLKKPVAEFLSCINLENDRLGEKTRETLGDLMSTYRQIAEQEYELGMVLDPQLIYNIEDISEAVKKMDIKEKRVSDLDLVTMEKLRTSIMSMETMLRNYNQTFRDGKKEQIDILAAKACEEIKERIKGIKKNSKIGAVKGFSDMLNFDMLNPWDYFHQMGGTFEELFGGLREGENRQIRNLAKSKAYLEEMTEKYGVSKKDMTDKSLKTFNLANGESLELTKAQVMSLYLLWRQNQTHEHITEGGIRPGKVTQKLIESKDGESKVKMSVSEDYNAVRPVLDDIAVILDTLSDNEKKFAESISDFFVDECADWGNEVALKLYGYKKFNTPNYFPIVSDKMYLQEDFGVSADATIKNMGITKRRIKHANNPIIIEDIFDVYARHVSDMAKYNAYVLPLQDVQRVFNSRSFDGDNNVKALVATKFGKQAVDYFSKLMVDINMGINNQYGNALSSNLISKYKQAKMGLNARVVVQQPMSYVRAAALIDAKYLAGAMGKKVDIETVFKYSPIAQWKSWGFFSTDTGKDMYGLMTGEKNLADYTMALAGKADEMTWKRIWAAVELETAELHPDLQKGSEKFYEVCGKRFDEIIDRTQVVDSTLHRSQALRSPDGFTKMAYSFMSEPLKTYNLLRSAAVDAISAKDAASKKILTRTIVVCAVSSILLACVTGAFDTLTGDDEEELLKNFADNLTGDALGMLPYVKDIYSVVRGFTVERMDMQGLSDAINAIMLIPKENYTWRYKVAQLAAKFAELGGVPVGSFKKSVYDLVLKNIFRGTDNFLAPYNMTKQMYYVDGGKKGEFINILFDAYSAGNKKHYNKILKDMIKEGLDAKTIESGLNSRFKKSGIKETFDVPWTKPYSITTEEDENKFGIKDLSASQYQSYQSQVTSLEKDIIGDLNRLRRGLSEDEYQKRLKAAYEYSTETALEKVAREKYESDKPWINKAQIAEEKYGLDPAEFIMFYKYFSELTPPAGREKFKTNEKKNLIIAYLNGMELTREEWNYLYKEVAGYKK